MLPITIQHFQCTWSPWLQQQLFTLLRSWQEYSTTVSVQQGSEITLKKCKKECLPDSDDLQLAQKESEIRAGMEKVTGQY